jgi:hypothetical protein
MFCLLTQLHMSRDNVVGINIRLRAGSSGGRIRVAVLSCE